MKKKLAIVFVAFFLVVGNYLIAQEEALQTDETQLQVSQLQNEQTPSDGNLSASAFAPSVSVLAGTLNLHMMLLTGLAMERTSGGNPFLSSILWNDGNAKFGMINPEWSENRAEVTFDWQLSGGMFGAIAMFRANEWGYNTFGSMSVPTAFAYANFGFMKFSMGKLWDGNVLEQRQLWKPDIEAGGGAERIAHDEDHLSARLEFMPMDGLIVGIQHFFTGSVESYFEDDAWREMAIGAEYRSDLFNANAGIRFDSATDGLSRQDFRMPLASYYGDWQLLGNNLTHETLKHIAADPDVPGVGTIPIPGRSPDAVDPATFDQGHLIVLGANIKAFENWTIQGRLEMRGIFDFERFGSGKAVQHVKRNNLLGGNLGIGLTAIQEFNGSDVFVDGMVNSPFLRFVPTVSYVIIPSPVPENPVPLLSTSLEVAYGIAPDVIDYFFGIYPRVEFSMGIFSLILQYDYEREAYKEGLQTPAGGYGELVTLEPVDRHKFGLGLRVMF